MKATKQIRVKNDSTSYRSAYGIYLETVGETGKVESSQCLDSWPDYDSAVSAAYEKARHYSCEVVS